MCGSSHWADEGLWAFELEEALGNGTAGRRPVTTMISSCRSSRYQNRREI